LIEVLVAMFILMCAFMGVMGLFQWADVGFWEAMHADRALAAAVSRLEAKRTMPWKALLGDDLDGNGQAEVRMRDDGVSPDEHESDGIFTAGTEQDGIRLRWTVQPDRYDRSSPASLVRTGSVVIMATAAYTTGRGQWREVRLGTIRANPNYVGPR